MIKLYLFERNVFTAIFFTPLSQQVIRSHISEMEKSTKMGFFVKVYTQMGGEIGHSEGKNLGAKGPLRYIHPRPLTRCALAGLECILTNHSSESIHIWTIGTLEGWLSFHDSSPYSPCPRVGLEVKI